jgi:hypothetical protein
MYSDISETPVEHIHTHTQRLRTDMLDAVNGYLTDSAHTHTHTQTPVTTPGKLLLSFRVVRRRRLPTYTVEPTTHEPRHQPKLQRLGTHRLNFSAHIRYASTVSHTAVVSTLSVRHSFHHPKSIPAQVWRPRRFAYACVGEFENADALAASRPQGNPTKRLRAQTTTSTESS